MVHQAPAGMRGKDVMGHGPQFPQSQTHTHTDGGSAQPCIRGCFPRQSPSVHSFVLWKPDRQSACSLSSSTGTWEMCAGLCGDAGNQCPTPGPGAFLLGAAQEYEGTPQGGHLQPPQPHPWLPSPLQLFLKEIPSRCLRPWRTPLPHPVGLLVHFLRWEPESQLLMNGSGSVCVLGK